MEAKANSFPLLFAIAFKSEKKQQLSLLKDNYVYGKHREMKPLTNVQYRYKNEAKRLRATTFAIASWKSDNIRGALNKSNK